MKKLILAGLVTLWMAGAAVAGPPLPRAFSADVTVRAKGETSTMKMFIDGDKIRSEVTARGHHVTSIIRGDRKLSYMVMDEQHMYMEMPLNDSGRPAAVAVSPANRSDAQIVLVGADVINGQACDKYSITTDGKLQGYEWRARGQVLPVRYASADGDTVMDYTNVHMGPVDSAMFEPPAGYQKLPMGAIPGH